MHSTISPFLYLIFPAYLFEFKIRFLFFLKKKKFFFLFFINARLGAFRRLLVHVRLGHVWV